MIHMCDAYCKPYLMKGNIAPWTDIICNGYEFSPLLTRFTIIGISFISLALKLYITAPELFCLQET